MTLHVSSNESNSFEELPEDRHVSVFINGAPYAQSVWEEPDRVGDAIEVLRTSSLSTSENRRISTGVLLFGKHPDPCYEVPGTPSGALRNLSSLDFNPELLQTL